jgi:hypothetical protein
MFAKYPLTIALAFATLVSLGARADQLNIKTGEWEMTTVGLTTGMPIPEEKLSKMSPEQRARLEQIMQAHSGKPSAHVRNTCVTKEKLAKSNIIKDDAPEGCTKKVIANSPTKVVVERTCAAPQESVSTISIEAPTPESVLVNVDRMQGGAQGKVHISIQGRWLGASCSAGTEAD